MLNPTYWSYTGIAYPPTWLYRGYTGHEHVPAFDLINMNARLYDPNVGRMLSPDNYVQDAYNSQNLNRFSYALNNPISNLDPDGNFIMSAFTGIWDLWATVFKGGLGPTSSSARDKAWRNYDPSAKWSKTNEAWRIDKGYYQTDKERTDGGRAWELFSRFTWEAPPNFFWKYLRSCIKYWWTSNEC
jgi:RHS repeat-associated protein